MTHSHTHTHHEKTPDPHHDIYAKTIFGFWLYLLSDFIFFAVLIATYLVLDESVFGGLSAWELLHPTFGFVQSVILLALSFSSGMGGATAHRKEVKPTLLYFGITFLLGALFFVLQTVQFSTLAHQGNSWDKSAFLSAFFSLTGTFQVHIIFGLLWTLVLLIPVWKEGLTSPSIRRLTCLRMFWQFLNLVWVFIFTAVYLIGRADLV